VRCTSVHQSSDLSQLWFRQFRATDIGDKALELDSPGVSPETLRRHETEASDLASSDQHLDLSGYSVSPFVEGLALSPCHEKASLFE
jgi:hypothetical protein